MIHTQNLLIIFYKNPVLGKIKTRLAKGIGEKAALTVYQTLVKNLVEATGNLASDKMVFYAEFVENDDIWSNRRFFKAVQRGKHIGERMKNAIEKVLNLGYQKTCLVGTDIYGLTDEILNEAFRQLDHVDVVIGPTYDGGYYLIGMKKNHNSLFYNKNWGNDTVYQATIDQLQREKISYSILPRLKDIDRPEDLEGTDLL